MALGRQWDAAVRGGKKLSADDLASNEGATTRSWNGTLPRTRWECCSPGNRRRTVAPCLTELAVIAHLYAESGDSKAEPLIEQLGDHLPAEAEALRGILAWRQGKVSESAERLAAGAGGGCAAIPGCWNISARRPSTRPSAWPRRIRSRPPSCCRRWANPLPSDYADESRRGTACVIAEGLGPAAVAQFVESFEPYVPWSERFLAYRRQAYRDAGHRLAAQAERTSRNSSASPHFSPRRYVAKACAMTNLRLVPGLCSSA